MWQDEWPTEPGRWWFYGYRFGRKGEKAPELCFVKVFRISNGIAYITHGHFLHKEEGAVGKWQKAILPELPEWS